MGQEADPHLRPDFAPKLPLSGEPYPAHRYHLLSEMASSPPIDLLARTLRIKRSPPQAQSGTPVTSTGCIPLSRHRPEWDVLLSPCLRRRCTGTLLPRRFLSLVAPLEFY